MTEDGKIFELYFDNSIDLLCVISKDGYFKKVNPEWQQTFGYSSDEMEGKQIIEFLHHDDIEKTLEVFRNHVETKNRVSNFSNRLRHKDGSFRWIEWRSFISNDLIYISARDITQRINVEETLKENEEKNKAIYSLTTDFVYTITVNGNKEKLVLYISEEFEKLIGLAIEDFNKGNKVNSVFYQDDLKIIENFEDEIINKRNGNSIYCRFNINSKVEWFYLTGKPIYNAITSKIESYYFAAKNIAKQKKHYEELDERGKLLDGIAQNVPGLVFQFYAGDNEQWRLSYVSNSSNKFLELDNRELDGLLERFISLLPKEEQEKFINSIKIAVKQKKPWTYEGVLKKHISREVRYFKAMSTPRIINKKLVFDGILLDITESKKNELEFQELSKLHETILDTITAGLVFAKNGKFVWANKAYLNIHNCKLKDIVDKPLSHFYTNKGDYEKIRLKALEDFANGRSYSKEIKTQNDDGSIRWVNFTGNPIRFNKPEDGTIWMVQDITKRRKDEEKVKQLAEMHQTILDTVSVGITYVKNREAQWGNAAYLKMFGFELNSPSIPPTITYSQKRDYDRIGIEAYQTFAQGLVYNTKVKAKKTDGSDIWVYLSGKAIDHKRPNDGSIWMTQNITETINTENELKKNESILKSTIESINDGLLVVDENRKITNFNNQFIKIFKIPHAFLYKLDEELLKEYILKSLKHPEFFINTIQEVYKTNEKFEDFFEFIDGRIIECQSFSLHENKPIKGRVWLFRDITTKKKTEENLKMFKYSSDYAMDAIMWLNKDGGIYYANEQACKSLGYTPEELMKLKLFNIDPIFSKERYDEEWSEYQINHQGGGQHIETLHKSKDGTLFPVEVVSKHIWIGDTELHVAHFRDITERKKQEENLLRNQKILTDSQRIAKIGSWDMDLSDFSMLWNRATYEIFGYKKFNEPITLETFFQFVHETDRDFVRKLIDESIKNKKLNDFECKVVRQDNSIINVIIVGEIELDENGEPVRMFGIVQNISERKQYEEALEKRVLALTRPLGDIKDIELTDLFSIDDLQKIQDSFAKATGVASIITYPDGKPITKPSNFCELCNLIRSTKKGLANCYKSDAYIGRKNFSGPTIQPCLSGGLWDAGASITLGGEHIANWLIGQVRNNEQDDNVLYKYGEEIGVNKKLLKEAMQEVKSMSKEQFENISNALYILAKELSFKAYQNVQQARFISEQKKAEDEVRKLNKNLEKKVEERTQKLNEVNKDLESFAFSVSHDLRAPLRHIDGYTRLLFSGIENPTDSVKDYFNKVKNSVVRMTHMIEDLLSFSRLGRKEINLRQVAIKKLINEIIKQYEQLPENYNIAWKVSNLPEVKGDANMLKLVFENLISNAVKYSSKNDNIKIEIGFAELSDEVEFYVKDNGCGFDMNYADKLFGVFQRLHKAEDFEGIGIGLANVKQIINKHNGTVRAESEIDKGATFYVTLPK